MYILPNIGVILFIFRVYRHSLNEVRPTLCLDSVKYQNNFS